MIRSASLARRSPLRAKSRLVTRTRIKPVNRKRKARLYEEQFGPKADWIRSLPCATCGAPGPSDPSHVKTRGARGKSEHLIPQDRRCHDELGRGVKTFEKRRGVNLLAMAAEYHERWQREGAEMPKFSVNASVVGSKHLGVFEAETAEQAEEMAMAEADVSLCHRCSDEVQDPEIDRVFVEMIGPSEPSGS